MFRNLWKDDAGIVAIEYLFVATIIGIGVTVGLENARVGINVELSELSEALMGLNQGYFVGSQSGDNGVTDASDVQDAGTPEATYLSPSAGSLTSLQIVDVTP
jgi:Flp pilus assembly pilin Flp